ncbi:MAG: YdcF family protein [Clostridiales bacterium]|nr:YdcF family protein [Clostridiales bacterium]
MKSKRKHPLRRLLVLLIILGAVAYAGIVGYVCIREGSVLKTVPAADNYDAIIVLGAQVTPDGSPSVQLGWRLDAAYEAWQQKPVPIVVCGAQGGDEPMPEAVAMEAYLLRKGVPQNDLLKDPDSFNTNQNLQNAAALLSSLPDIKTVLIVTSDYHVPRSLAIAQDLGFDACGMGSPCKPEYWLKNHAREALAWCKYWGKKYLHLPLE